MTPPDPTPPAHAVEPRTEAGRAEHDGYHLRLMTSCQRDGQKCRLLDSVLAIEREAAAPEPTREALFWKAAGEWQKAGSGMTREQKTGAAMVWSWLSGDTLPASPEPSDD